MAVIKVTHRRKQTSQKKKTKSSVFHARSSPLTLVLLRSSGSPGNVIKMPCIHNNETRINSGVFGNLQQALCDDSASRLDAASSKAGRVVGVRREDKEARLLNAPLQQSHSTTMGVN